MRYLLDTHAFLWFINNDAALSAMARNLIQSNAVLLLSTASLWEIAIKTSIGKLTLPDAFANFIPPQIAANKITVLPIEIAQLDAVSTLPFHHKDPFDRLLIAAAITENVPVISVDAAFDAYPVKREW